MSEMLLLDFAEDSIRSLWEVFHFLDEFVWQFEDAWVAVFLECDVDGLLDWVVICPFERARKPLLHKNGTLILAEPVWLAKPVSSEVLRTIGEAEDSFPTESEMRQSLEESGFKVLGHYVSSKEDWELYVKPVYIAIQEIVENNSELADEARKVLDGFKAEYDAAGQHWNMLLWVAKTF